MRNQRLKLQVSLTGWSNMLLTEMESVQVEECLVKKTRILVLAIVEFQVLASRGGMSIKQSEMQDWMTRENFGVER